MKIIGGKSFSFPLSREREQGGKIIHSRRILMKLKLIGEIFAIKKTEFS